MRITFHRAVRIADGVWGVALHQTVAARLPGKPISQGNRSVVLAEKVDFDRQSHTLNAEVDALRVVNLGWGGSGWVILAPKASSYVLGDFPKQAGSMRPKCARRPTSAIRPPRAPRGSPA